MNGFIMLGKYLKEWSTFEYWIKYTFDKFSGTDKNVVQVLHPRLLVNRTELEKRSDREPDINIVTHEAMV